MLPYDTPPSDSQTPDIQITQVQDSGVQEPGVPCQGTPGPADARSVASELDASSMAASRWQQLALALILLLAAGLRLWRLDQNGYGNSYYAAAVRSMLLDWGNFFFGSFDPAGFITVDKPPVAIWIQALSAKLLGYHGFTLLLPQALLGVGSVLLVYYLVRRIFGVLPGLIAGLAAAITPIGVAVDRDNLPDSALVFVLLLATWAWSRAAETGRLSRLLLAAALVGIGFNVKMLAAFVVLPTLYLVYLVASPLGWKSRVAHLTLATLVLGLVSLSWSIVVELTPKDRRPYIGGSKNNSAIELALGYNGFGRVFGGLGNFGPGNRRPPNMRPRSANARNAQLPGADNGPPNRPNGPPPWDDEDRRADRPTQGRPTAAINTNAPAAFASRPDNARPDDDEPPFPPGAGPGMPPNGFGPPGAGFPPGGPGGMPGGPPFGGPGGPGGPGGGFGGPPGFLRFARVVIAGQITWLFPLAIIGALVAGCRIRWRRSVGPERIALLVWAGWLATHWVTFSFAQGIFHEYYTIVMGPAVAALAGIGVAVLWDESGRRDWRRFLLPATLLVTGLWQCYILTQYAQLRYTLVPVVLGGAVLGAAGLVAARWLARRWPSVAWGKIAATCGVAALLIGPATWSLAAAATRGNAVMPAADPSAWLAGPGGRMGMRFMPPLEGRSTGTAQLVAFLRANHRGERYFVAAPSSMEAAQIIIETGEPAIALGGFTGGDQVLTKDEFAALVQDGQIRFFLLGGGPGGAPGGPGGMPGGMRTMRTGLPGQMPGGGNGRPGGFPGGMPDDMGGIPGRMPGGAARGMPGGAPPGMAGGPGGPGGPGNAEIQAWVREHGKLVDAKLWQPDEPIRPDGPASPVGRMPQAATGGPFGSWSQNARRGFAGLSAMARRMGGMRQLYDLRPDLGLVASPVSEKGSQTPTP